MWTCELLEEEREKPEQSGDVSRAEQPRRDFKGFKATGEIFKCV